MSDVIYPPKFKDRILNMFGAGKLSEPEITLDMQQILTLFNHSSTYIELKKYKPGSDMIEYVADIGSGGRIESITFRLFNNEERKKRSGR